MRNLLIALLLAIFSLQATVVAVEGQASATLQADRVHAHASPALSEAPDAADHEDSILDSAAVDELSDYLPAALPAASAGTLFPPSRSDPALMRSAPLRPATPPPRA